MNTSKAYNKKIITALVMLSLSALFVATANSGSLTPVSNSNKVMNESSKEWPIVRALGGYQVVELLDYSINHH